MILDIRKLLAPLEMDLAPNPGWLTEIFEELEKSRLHSTSVRELRGHALISPIENEICEVSIALHYQTDLECGRCLENFVWTMKLNSKLVYFDREDPLEDTQEVNLNSSEIKDNYLADGCLDLKQLFNELITLELPNPPRHDPEKEPCLSASELDEETPIYSSGDDDDSHPFAALKKLKN